MPHVGAQGARVRALAAPCAFAPLVLRWSRLRHKAPQLASLSACRPSRSDARTLRHALTRLNKGLLYFTWFSQQSAAQTKSGFENKKTFIFLGRLRYGSPLRFQVLSAAPSSRFVLPPVPPRTPARCVIGGDFVLPRPPPRK